jgi:hypothetical protein
MTGWDDTAVANNDGMVMVKGVKLRWRQQRWRVMDSACNESSGRGRHADGNKNSGGCLAVVVEGVAKRRWRVGGGNG